MVETRSHDDLIRLKPDRVIPHPSDTGPVEIVLNPYTGLIDTIGSPDEISARLADETRPVQVYEGGLVIPSITDAHDHVVPDAGSAVLRDLSLHGIADQMELTARLTEEVARRRDEGSPHCLVARGWDTRMRLTRDDLDAISREYPILVLDPSNHSGVANSEVRARMQTRIDELGVEPNGDVRDSGQITEGYASLAKVLAIESIPSDQLESALEAVLLERVSHGTTSVHELMVRSAHEIEVIARLRQRWESQHGYPFPITMGYIFPSFTTPHPTDEIRKALEAGYITKAELGSLGIKFFADGAFGAHSARLSEPYIDEPDNFGHATDTPEDMIAILKKAAELGVNNVAIHAIGDAAIQNALRVAEEWQHIAAAHGLDPRKFRIEHFELPTPVDETLKRMRDLGVWAGPQPNFLTDYIYGDRLGDRIQQISPHRTIQEAGVNMLYGTDRMPASPLFAMWCAVHALYANQRLSFEEALRYFTETPAQLEDANRGVLEVGANADVVVADASFLDIMNDPSRLLERRRDGESVQAELDGVVRDLRGTIQRVYVAGKPVSIR